MNAAKPSAMATSRPQIFNSRLKEESCCGSIGEVKLGLVFSAIPCCTPIYHAAAHSANARFCGAARPTFYPVRTIIYDAILPSCVLVRARNLVTGSPERLCMNSSLKTLALAALCLSLAVASSQPAQAASDSQLHWVADVPLLACDGLPCIDARINGATVRMLIDTGNEASVFDSARAKTLGIQLSALDQPGASKDIFRATIPSVSIGSLKLTNLRVLTMGLAKFVAQNQMPHADGSLAYTVFKDRAIQMDFHSRRFRVSEVTSSTLPCSGACDTFSLITFGKEGPPIVVAKGFTINGQPVTAQIDTQYSGSLLVYTASIDKLGLSNAAKTDNTKPFPYTDGGVKMKFAPAQGEGFHDLSLAVSHPVVYFPTPGVHEPDALFDATVGIALFRDAVLTLDFHNSTVSVQKG